MSAIESAPVAFRARMYARLRSFLSLNIRRSMATTTTATRVTPSGGGGSGGSRQHTLDDVTHEVDADGDSLIQDDDDDDDDNDEDAQHASRSVPTPPSAAPTIQPSGPICSYGPRLAYTYFATTATTTNGRGRPLPAAEQLNQMQRDIHFFTVDDQLVYLSFYQDSGPLNAACL